jgi:hypothetical protein
VAGLVPSDAYCAYVLAYDAARFVCIAQLAQQGLLATTSGGHYVVEQAVGAQFGEGFRLFGVGAAATNWNTRTCPQIRTLRRKPGRHQGSAEGHCCGQAAFPKCPSAKTRSYGTIAGNRGMESCLHVAGLRRLAPPS